MNTSADSGSHVSIQTSLAEVVVQPGQLRSSRVGTDLEPGGCPHAVRLPFEQAPADDDFQILEVEVIPGTLATNMVLISSASLEIRGLLTAVRTRARTEESGTLPRGRY